MDFLNTMPPSKPLMKIQPSLRKVRSAASRKRRSSKRKHREMRVPSFTEEESSFSKRSSDSDSDEIVAPEPIGEILNCSLCEEIFYDPIYLNWHVMIEHGKEVVGTLKIKQESNFFRSPAKSKYGQQVSSLTLKTSKCFGRKYDRQASSLGLKTSTPFTCKRCAKVLTTSWSLGRHMKLHQSKALSCKICKFRALNSKRLTQHVEVCHWESDATGGTSSKTGVGKSLNQKAKSCNTSASYRCPLCEATFASDGGIKYHVKVRHTDETSELECKRCDFTTEDLLEFVNHRLSHDEEKIFNCDFCRKPFSSKSGKLNHEKLHGTRTNFSTCPFCKIVFFGHGPLKNHILTVHCNK